MEQGDLSTWLQPRLVVVLEGVLAEVTEEVTRKYLGLRRYYNRNFNWLEIPLKRLVYLKNRWPDTSIEIVTFLDQAAADEAARFFDQSYIPYSAVSYHRLDDWVQEILWQPDIQTIYDSDLDRIMRYGQRGFIVQRGRDF